MRRETFLERPLPSSEESERAVLGAIILNNDLIYQVIGKLEPEDFYSPLHRRIFTAMVELFEHGKIIEPIAMSEVLKRDGTMESIGGITAITNLVFGIPHYTNIDQHVSTVAERSRSRRLIRICNETVSNTLEENDDLETVMHRHETALFELREGQGESGFHALSVIGDSTVRRLKAFQENALDGLVGISTGYKDLDTRTAGLEQGDLIVLGARPSMGKTALALKIGLNAARTEKKPVIPIFSLEMSESQLVQRIISSEARVDLRRLRIGMLTREEWLRVDHVTSQLHSVNLYIDDTPALTTLDIRARLRRIQREKGEIGLVVIDHLGLIRSLHQKNQRHLQLSEITKELKAIAKEFNVPMLVLHQLSREVEKRKPPKPMLSDLRESGAIEEDADIVWFIYREDYYNKDREPNGIAEIICDKNRNGPTGIDKLAFIKEFTVFETAYLA